MEYQIPKSIYGALKHHYLNGDFNSIDVTFYHLGCEILFNKIEGDQLKPYQVSKDLYSSFYTFLSNNIANNCNLELYIDDLNHFKIDLTLIIEHTKNENFDFELDMIIDQEVVNWVSNYVGKLVDRDCLSISLFLLGSSKSPLLLEDFDLTFFILNEKSRIEINSEFIVGNIKERIFDSIGYLIKPLFGSFSSSYSYTVSVNEDAKLSIFENCYIGELAVRE
jgi:hypothetical protein